MPTLPSFGSTVDRYRCAILRTICSHTDWSTAWSTDTTPARGSDWALRPAVVWSANLTSVLHLSDCSDSLGRCARLRRTGSTAMMRWLSMVLYLAIGLVSYTTCGQFCLMPSRGRGYGCLHWITLDRTLPEQDPHRSTSGTWLWVVAPFIGGSSP